MSHITTVDVEIRADNDGLAALQAACDRLGVQLRRDQKTFRNYGGRNSKCDMAIVDPANERAYEVGLVMNKDGKSYQIKLDNFMGGNGMMDKVGFNAGTLIGRYGLNMATAQAQKQGMRVVGESVQQDGSIRLVLEPKQQFAFAAKGF